MEFTGYYAKAYVLKRHENQFSLKLMFFSYTILLDFEN